MMDFRAEHIIKVWEKISVETEIATQIKTFFQECFETGCTSNFRSDDFVIRMLRGFECSDEYHYQDDRFHMVFCLDLHNVQDMTNSLLRKYHSYLIENGKPYSKCKGLENITFYDIYRRVLEKEETQKDKKKARKKK